MPEREDVRLEMKRLKNAVFQHFLKVPPDFRAWRRSEMPEECGASLFDAKTGLPMRWDKVAAADLERVLDIAYEKYHPAAQYYLPAYIAVAMDDVELSRSIHGAIVRFLEP